MSRKGLVLGAVFALLTLTACGWWPGTVTAITAGGSLPATPTMPAPLPAAPAVAADRCATNQSAQRVIVSLHAQRMWLCSRSATAYATPITSGRVGPHTSTPTGHYKVQPPSRNVVLRPNTGEVYPVKYWIPFDAPDFGFHDASWQHFPYGSPQYRTGGSHGCIHMPLHAIAFFFDWTQVGTPVDIEA